MKKYLVSAMCALAIAGMSATAASAATFTFSSSEYVRLPETGTRGTTDPYPLTIDVHGIRDVTDVNVSLHGLSHTWSSDLEIYLRGPYPSQRVWLMRDEGGGADWVDNDLTFDDSASTGDPSPGSNQTIRPNGSLSYFNGRDPNGAWRLYIRDAAYYDIGSLEGWSLTFEATQVPLPAGFPLLLAGLGAFGVLRHRRKKA